MDPKDQNTENRGQSAGYEHAKYNDNEEYQDNYGGEQNLPRNEQRQDHAHQPWSAETHPPVPHPPQNPWHQNNNPYDNPVSEIPLPPSPHEKQSPKASYTPANLILQWLTYAFWGWTIVAMSVLTADVIYSFISNHSSGDFTAYAIAAVLVLLPISVVTDYFYSKQEPPKKTGPASIILIIHAVIFALFGIGSIITAVFALVSMGTSSGENTGSVVTFFSAIIIAFFYALVFIRTMDFPKLWRVKKYFTKIMIGLVGLIIVMAIIGPFAEARKTRNDHLISDNISTVQSAINSYAKDNKKLPENLSQLTLSHDAKILVDKNLLKYTPNTKDPENVNTDYNKYSGSNTSLYSNTTPIYYYTICATFTEESDYSYNDYGYSDSSYGDQSYQTNPNYYYYTAGENCYKIKTSTY